MVPSPCIDICDVNSPSGYCRGCYRSLQEIAEWPYMNDTERTAVLMVIQQRKKAILGFTLMELSIVLVIIGLVIGGSILGNAIVEQARMRKQITQIDKIEAGIRNFRIKYDCLPGDCLDPTIINGYISGGVTYTGNGDGFLDATAWNSNENTGFWIHLTASNMIDDALVTNTVPTAGNIITPEAVVKKQSVINAYGNIATAQNILEFDTTSVSGVFNSVQILGLDTKMDDGIAASGNIRPTGYGTGTTTVYATAPVFPLSSSNNSGATQCISAGAYSALAAIDACNMVYILGN